MTVMPNLNGARVTVVGLGVEGIDLVRYLAAEGARVTVSDARSREDLAEAITAIAGCDAALSLGENRAADLVEADCVFVSQGVPQELPALAAARERGVPLSSMTRLFMERCPAPIAGITGSSGKTTTTALIGAMLDATSDDYVVGGNIGTGLLSLLDRVGPETKVVVEFSHTQLESVTQSPHLACVTNVTPNHLDRYSWTSYVDLKRRIFSYQRPEDVAIFNVDDEVAAGFASEAPGAVEYTAMRRPLPGDGVELRGEAIVRVAGGRSIELMSRDEIPLRGDHNVANVLSALAVSTHLDVDDAVAAAAIRSFAGVPHRLEPVVTVAGVDYVNDSIATTPDRTLAGIRSFDQPIVLILGGRDKHLPLRELAAEVRERCRAVVTFGEAAELFGGAMRDGAPDLELRETATVEEATRVAAELASAGDVVLCSPAGTSFDAYRGFEQRGDAFRRAARALAGA